MNVIVNKGSVVVTAEKMYRPGEGLKLKAAEAVRLIKRGVVKAEEKTAVDRGKTVKADAKLEK